jgi:hypothetical protein
MWRQAQRACRSWQMAVWIWLLLVRVSGSRDMTLVYVPAVVAQACHWFDWNKMWPELARVLRKDGSAAFWVRIPIFSELLLCLMSFSFPHIDLFRIPPHQPSLAHASNQRLRPRPRPTALGRSILAATRPLNPGEPPGPGSRRQ